MLVHNNTKKIYRKFSWSRTNSWIYPQGVGVVKCNQSSLNDLLLLVCSRMVQTVQASYYGNHVFTSCGGRALTRKKKNKSRSLTEVRTSVRIHSYTHRTVICAERYV